MGIAAGCVGRFDEPLAGVPVSVLPPGRVRSLRGAGQARSLVLCTLDERPHKGCAAFGLVDPQVTALQHRAFAGPGRLHPRPRDRMIKLENRPELAPFWVAERDHRVTASIPIAVGPVRPPGRNDRIRRSREVWRTRATQPSDPQYSHRVDQVHSPLGWVERVGEVLGEAGNLAFLQLED